SVKAEVVEADDAGKVTYKSSDEKVVTVDENGVVTAVGEGYAVISANVYKGRAVYCAVSVTPEELYVYESLGNPYLPIWEHIPDGEPYVFEDPDNPGKYRVYVYGSHDTKLSHYCGYEQVVWSAPVDDLTKWTYHGEIFKSTVQGTKDTLYAPDMVEVVNADGSKTYYFYPNNQTGGRRGMVAKSSRPDGPFLTCNWSDENITETVGPLGFDVAVLYDDDGRVYGYWGFENNEDCCFAELDPNTMATLKEGTEIRLNLPTRTDISSPKYDPSKYNIYQDEYVDMWGFFEAPSIRKIGNKYVLIFSRRGLLTEPTGCNTFQLAYGYSDSPEGPWKWGGIIVDAGGEAIPKTSTSYDRTFPADNTHGSICEINGQWYVFYHRSNNRYSRQSTLDAITVEWDEKSVAEGGKVSISMAETTSNGMYLDGLEPYRQYPASIVCYLTGGSNILAEYDKDKIDPVVIASSQSVAGVKYFNFDKNAPVGKSTSLAVTLRPLGKDVKVDVYLRPVSAVNTPPTYDGNRLITSVGEGSFKIGTVNITADMEQVPVMLTLSSDEIDSLDGKWGIFFVFTGSGSNLCEFHSFELYTDKPTEDKEEEENSAVIYDFTKMTESELLENFDIVRENKDHYEISKSGLTVNNQKAGLYGGGGSCENIFLADVEGDFVAEVKVTMSEALSANWQQFVLLVYQNDDNYVKMNYGMNGGTGCQLLFEKDGSEKKSYGAGLSTTEIWLRIEKVGKVYRGFYSTDGISYTLIGEAYEFALENVKIGLAAHNDGGDAPSIDFNIEYLKIEKK
ncbi:MAG: family 43 glycosylhydrolase, partial [Clostridia bacterium]|nr:family 43 glycosylhydrolase [Clostridia bacterium]